MAGKKTAEPKQVLQVLLYRKDEAEPTVIMESDNFAQCKKVWKQLIEKWTKAHKEAEPFVLESPIVTAIEPGIVAEIKVFPKMEPQLQIDPNNPYQRDMLNRGLAQSMRGVAPGNIYDNGAGGIAYSDMMDEGYK